MNRQMRVFDHEAIEGEVLREAVIDARDMCSMNFAREEHKKLEKILLTFVIPAMGGYDNELACDIARHIEQIRTFSGNFCWRHRHLGASHGVVGKRAEMGEGGRNDEQIESRHLPAGGPRGTFPARLLPRVQRLDAGPDDCHS